MTLPPKSNIVGSYPKQKSKQKCKMNQEVDKITNGSNINSISQPTLYNDYKFIFLRTKEIPRVGDIWVLHYIKFIDHFTCFFIPSIKTFFQARDNILRVESSK
jgi:hypothetical protein